ncbi:MULTISPECIES: hypothetical protein [unclassified Sphingobacterium]|uniref:hypothetical protein n=1 Tax=unclassified Sphingobacterium TaxID=2609468 RepID=UPI0025F9AA20|nr:MULTISPECIES: hypothetical protein [unclassified Sphingobacterium]
MNFNILAYTVYGLLTCYIIIWVGRLFHRNGRIFILSLFQQDINLADTTNNLLLLGYYLLNIGYAILQFSYWKQIASFDELISSIAFKTGRLLFVLVGLHYINMLAIYFFGKRKNSLTIKH